MNAALRYISVSYLMVSAFTFFEDLKAMPPLPKTVATKSAPCNMRVGPGKQFPIDWVYNYPGTPFKVLAEFQGWYKVKDKDGTLGWITRSLLTTKRQTKVVIKEVSLLKTDAPNSRIEAVLRPNVLVTVKFCKKELCKVYLKHDRLKLSGYLPLSHLWPN
jgi:SH3-like domain-containing protein